VDHQAKRRFEARQFPKSSGYPEDAATGIAAAALAFGLLGNGLVARDSERITIMQGRAMGALSEIRVRLGFADSRPVGCLLGGSVALAQSHVLQL
jgi:predicted PhzF superfamily epimerase YddE/YHI9